MNASKMLACRIIANVMTNREFMNGWLGERSDEFKLQQAYALYILKRGNPETPSTADWWVLMNYYNMSRYCRIPDAVIVAAFGDVELRANGWRGEWLVNKGLLP